MKERFLLLWDALFLREEAYTGMAAGSKPMQRGLVLVLIIGAALAVTSLVGTLLNWSMTPNLDMIKSLVLDAIKSQPYFPEISRNPESLRQFQQYYDLGWRIFPVLFGAPSIAGAFSALLIAPLGLLISWLVYGVLVHLFARLLGGKAGMAQTLGVTALALAPQLLSLTALLPGIALGNVVGLWMLLCRYRAVRIAHDLPWFRALLAVLLPKLLLVLLMGIVLAAGVAVFSATGGAK